MIEKIVSKKAQNNGVIRDSVKAEPIVSKKDEFILGDKKSFIQGAAKYFSKFDINEIMNSLLLMRTWNNGVDFISGSYDANFDLNDMQIGIFDFSKGEYKVESLTKKEFLEFIESLKDRQQTGVNGEDDGSNELFGELKLAYEKYSKYN